LLVLLLSFCFVLNAIASPSEKSKPPIVLLAAQYVGTQEVTPNSSPVIDSMLAFVGLKPGAPWCAADVSFLLDKSGAVFPNPSPTALGFRDRHTSISALDVYSGLKTVPDGSIFIMQKGVTWQGHCGIVNEFTSRLNYETYEGNTSKQPGTIRSESDGDGHWPRSRTVEPYNYFGVKWFTPVRYKSDFGPLITRLKKQTRESGGGGQMSDICKENRWNYFASPHLYQAKFVFLKAV